MPAKENDESSPSGATDRAAERTKKFDEEGGDQPQAPSQAAVDRELRQVQSQHGSSQHQRQELPTEPRPGRPTDSEPGRDSHPTPFDEGSDDDLPVDRESFRHQKPF
jgi:hypothetical protein